MSTSLVMNIIVEWKSLTHAINKTCILLYLLEEQLALTTYIDHSNKEKLKRELHSKYQFSKY